MIGEVNWIEKFKVHNWYISNITEKYQKGRLLYQRQSPAKDSWVYECTSKQSNNVLCILKTVRRVYSKTEMSDLYAQITTMYELSTSNVSGNRMSLRVLGFDIFREGNDYFFRIVTERCTGSLRSLLITEQANPGSANPKSTGGGGGGVAQVVAEDLIESAKFLVYNLSELEGKADALNSLNMRSAFTIANPKSGKICMLKFSGYSPIIWSTNATSIVPPKESNPVQTICFRCGLLLSEIAVGKEYSQWGFTVHDAVKTKNLIFERCRKLNVSDRIADIIIGLLAVQPEQRYSLNQSLQLLHRALNLQMLPFQPINAVVGGSQQSTIGNNSMVAASQNSVVQKGSNNIINNSSNNHQGRILRGDEEQNKGEGNYQPFQQELIGELLYYFFGLDKIKQGKIDKQAAYIFAQDEEIERLKNEMSAMVSSIKVLSEKVVEIELQKSNGGGSAVSSSSNRNLDHSEPPEQSGITQRRHMFLLSHFDSAREKSNKTSFDLILSSRSVVNRGLVMCWLADSGTVQEIAEYLKKNIEAASRSRRSDEILVMMHGLFRKGVDEKVLKDIFNANQILATHLLRYMTAMMYSNDSILSIAHAAPEAWWEVCKREAEINNALKGYKLTREYLLTGHFSPVATVGVLDDQIRFTTKHGANTTVNGVLDKLYDERDNANVVAEFVKVEKVSERSAVIRQFRSMMRLRLFERADTFIEKNYKGSGSSFVLAPELIAMEFMKERQQKRASKYLRKIDDAAYACDMLLLIGDVDSAVEHAKATRSAEAVQLIKSKSPEGKTKLGNFDVTQKPVDPNGRIIQF